MAGELILGYNGTDGAKATLDLACDLARDLDTGLVVAYAYEPQHMGGEIGPHRDALEQHGREVTAQALKTAREAGIDAEAVLVRKRPAPGLADLAAERGARLILVGSYGESPLKSAILGSVPHKLLQISDIPVLVWCD